MHKPTLIAAHFILPNRTQAHPPPDKWTVDNLDGVNVNKRAKNRNLPT
jgi:hypothetical protein